MLIGGGAEIVNGEVMTSPRKSSPPRLFLELDDRSATRNHLTNGLQLHMQSLLEGLE